MVDADHLARRQVDDRPARDAGHRPALIYEPRRLDRYDHARHDHLLARRIRGERRQRDDGRRERDQRMTDHRDPRPDLG